MILTVVDGTPWFIDIEKSLARGAIPAYLNTHYSKKFFHDINYYYGDDPLLFQSNADNMMHSYVLEVEIHSIIKYRHVLPCGGQVLRPCINFVGISLKAR